MRKLFARVLALSLLVATLPAVAMAQEQEDEQFLFEGSGWGHGVGMSQYGARGLALEGKGAADIISYFYRG
ncbi:MAG: hypothetical protein M3N51_12205, partial [Actinomycetota bacterium]|nr:hypothetical protein [Actinomycetota bacterium]